MLCNFLLGAGHETTANLLSGSLRYLLERRQLWEQLGAAPEMIPTAVEELLRFVSPVLWLSRLPAEDVELVGEFLKFCRNFDSFLFFFCHDFLLKLI